MQTLRLLCYILEACLLCPGRGFEYRVRFSYFVYRLKRTALSTYGLNWNAGFKFCTGTPILVLNAVLKTLGTTRLWVNGWSLKLFHCLHTVPKPDGLPQARVFIHDVALRYWDKSPSLTSALNEITSWVFYKSDDWKTVYRISDVELCTKTDRHTIKVRLYNLLNLRKLLS